MRATSVGQHTEKPDVAPGTPNPSPSSAVADDVEAARQTELAKAILGKWSLCQQFGENGEYYPVGDPDDQLTYITELIQSHTALEKLLSSPSVSSPVGGVSPQKLREVAERIGRAYNEDWFRAYEIIQVAFGKPEPLEHSEHVLQMEREQRFAKIIAATGIQPDFLPEWCNRKEQEAETLMLIGEAMGWTREQLNDPAFNLRESLLGRVKWLEKELPESEQRYARLLASQIVGERALLRKWVERHGPESKEWKDLDLAEETERLLSLRDGNSPVTSVESPDTKRLDWLELNAFQRVDENTCRQSLHVGLLGKTFESGKTLRDAIDAAMSASPVSSVERDAQKD